jgi:thioesterase domain-containing protein
VLARQAAINAVKSELQRRGERVASVAMRDIRIQADAYLAARPELIDEVRDRAERLGIFERKSRRWAVASSC